MSTVLLLVIAAVAPWTIHLAPPRQRGLALVGVLAVFLLYGIFAQNPLVRWESWAGLAVGVISVLLASGGMLDGLLGGGNRGSRPARSRTPRRGGGRPRVRAGAGDSESERTGEL